MPSLAELMKEKLSEEKKEVKEVKIPSKVPSKKVKTEKTTKIGFNLQNELEELAKTSDFQRLIFKAITGKVHRGSKVSLQNELRSVIQKLRND